MWGEFSMRMSKFDLKIFSFRRIFTPTIQTILDPFMIILPQMDFLKDMILVVRLITLLGGIVVFTNPHLFSSNVSKSVKIEVLHSLFFFTTSFLGNLSAHGNNLCSTIPWNNKLCIIKSSKQERHKAHCNCSSYDCLFPIVFIRPTLYGFVLGPQAEAVAK